MSPLVLPRTLESAVEKLPDIGAVNAKRLAKLGIETIRDLLLTLPFGWDSYGAPTRIADLRVGEQATIVGKVGSITAKRSPRRGIRLTEGTVVDAAGDELDVAWFNQPWVANQLHSGDPVAIAGTVKFSRFAGVHMQNPHYERLGRDGDGQPSRVGGMMPKYHLVQGLTSRRVAQWVDNALSLADQLEDVIPDEVRARHNLVGVAEPVRTGHKPKTEEE